ncbi:MAG TPA: S4 domain-containing protein, partial [Candidatus Limnocylindrales bacterium]|nr:S4 domain-containing protein [Candidatus Limnocylindrales bacterium]
MADVRTLTVPPDAEPQRVDRFVADVTGLSRSYVQRLIATGRVTVGGEPVKARMIVGPGTRVAVEIPPPEPVELEPEPAIELRVVYEDDDLLIVDKPAGLVVHPGAGHQTDTLANALVAYLGRAPTPDGRPGIVHR